VLYVQLAGCAACRLVVG